MGRLARARLLLNLNGPWRLYQPRLPDGWEALGTVQRGMEIGALVRNKATGLYAQMNAGAVISLDQRKVAAALGATAS